MPEGVEVVVADGFATIDFVDSAKRGQGLDALLKIGTPPEAIEKATRPRVTYTVPEGNAREAGLLDEGTTPLSNADGPLILTPDPSETPDDTWKVDELKAYAEKHNIDLDGASRKADILAVINKPSEATPPGQ